MTIILDGTTGITTPAINSSGDLELPGGTANGVLYLNGSKIATSGSALVFDGTNLGVGVTPSAWSTAYKAFQLNGNAALSAFTTGIGQTNLSHNLYREASNWKFLGNDAASLYAQTSGIHYWYNTASGTAGGNATLIQAMTLDASGNLGVGLTAPKAKVHAEENGGTSTTPGLIVTRNIGGNASGNGGRIRFGTYDANLYGADIYAIQNGYADDMGLAFATYAPAPGLTERARITSGGDLLVGTTAALGRVTTSGGGDQAIYFTHNDNSPGRTVTLRLGNNNSTFHTYSPYIQAIQGSGIDNYSLAFGTSSGAAAVERARITGAGEFLVGGTTDNGAYNLQCNGTGVWGAGAYVNGSDARLKDNIQSIDSCLDVVNALRPVTFQYKPEHSKDQSVQTGFIAQELQQALAGKPYLDGLVQEGPEYLNVAYQNIIPLLTKAIQEQQAMIEDLKAEIDQLKGT